MTKLSVFSPILLTVLLLGLPTTLPRDAAAQDKPAQAPAAEPYAPGLGDFMTAYVQPHHIKLGLAGRAGNWKLAEYEAKELDETFEDVTTYQGTWNELPVGKLVETLLSPSLAAVEKAIESHDAKQFNAAYRQLTSSCTSCHQATHMDFLVITVPSRSPYPDQRFAPR